jgi:hypothetical protein
MRRSASLSFYSWIVVSVFAALLLLLPTLHAFATPALVHVSRTSSGGLEWELHSSSSSFEDQNDYSEAEMLDMTELISSLSLEPTDHDRRTRVKDIFQEALGRPNGSPKRFTDLFDKTLIQFGEKVQNEAKKKYFEDQEKAAVARGAEESEVVLDGSGSESIADTAEDSSTPVVREKTPEELQLWALVDMMVQTKTIVKKHSGELGSKGSFQ